MDDEGSVGQTGNVYFSCVGDALVINQALSCAGKRILRVASGHDALLALCDEGTVNLNTGDDTSTQAFVDIARGTVHSIGQSAEGGLFAWGSNDNGQLGIGAGVAETAAPKRVVCRIVAEQMATSATHSAVADAHGDLYTWGANFQGQLALHLKDNGAGSQNGHEVILLPRFVPFSSKNKINCVACGDGFTLVATRQGAVWGWGSSDCGQLGVRRKSAVQLPDQVLECDPEDGSPINKLVCGRAHVLCGSTSGNVYSWGLNSHGQLGRDAASTSSWQPALVDMMPSGMLFASDCMSAAITENGRLYTWGLNSGCKLLHDHQQHALAIPTLVEAFAGVEVADFCFGAFGSAVLVRSKVYTILPTLAPWNQTAVVELQGGGLFDEDNAVVRFTYEMSQRPGRAALARYEDGEGSVGRLICAPPVLTQPGEYRVEFALDGITFLHAGWIQFYQPVQLIECSPQVIDVSTTSESPYLDIVFQCDQAVDSSLADDEIKIKLQSIDGQTVILDTHRPEGERVSSRRQIDNSRSSSRRSGRGSIDQLDNDSPDARSERSMNGEAADEKANKHKQAPTKLHCIWDLQNQDVQLPFVAHMALSMNTGVDWSTPAKQPFIIHKTQVDAQPAIWCSLACPLEIRVTGAGFMVSEMSASFKWQLQSELNIEGNDSDAQSSSAAEEQSHTIQTTTHDLPVSVQSPTSLTITFDPSHLPHASEESNTISRGAIELSVGDVTLERPELPLRVACYHEQDITSTTEMVCAAGGNTVHVRFEPLQALCETMVVQLKVPALDWEEVVPATTVQLPAIPTEPDGTDESAVMIVTEQYEVVCTIPQLPEDALELADEQRILELRLMPNGLTPTQSALLLPIYPLPAIRQLNPATAKAGAAVTVTLDYVMDSQTASVRLRSVEDNSVDVPATVKVNDSCVSFVIPGTDVLSSIGAKGKQVFVDVSLDGQVYATSKDSKLTIK